jgi:serine/threonine protein phosphatase 1
MHWVVGDIHGMLHPLKRLLRAVNEDDSSARLVFAGDYVNRGPDSCKVIDLLLTLKNAHFIRGNHDDVFDLVLHGHSYAESAASSNPALAFQWFMDFGIDSTFYSYGADWHWLNETARHPTPERMAKLTAFVPEAHRNFIHSLPPVYEHDDFFVLHGRWAPAEKCYPPSISENLRTDPELRQNILWARFPKEEISAEKAWSRRGFFGHTPVHSYASNPRSAAMVPIIGPNIVLLDTAAALTTAGRLTAYCVEENRYIQTSHFGELIEETAGRAKT